MSRIPIRYLPWMVRDILLAQGMVLLAIGFLVGLIMTRMTPSPPASEGLGLVKGFVQQMGWPFILYSVASMVSADRVQGFYRSYFSRPLSPPGFYLMRWLLGAVIVALLVPVLTLSLSLAIGRFPLSWSLLAQLQLNYLLVGGLVFLLSTTVRADWLVALLFMLVESILGGLKRGGIDLPAVWDFVATILPPFHLVSVNSPLPAGTPLVHVLLYGAGLVLAALAVIRWRPLGAGGRS